MGKQQISSADAVWLHMDRPTNLTVVTCVLWFEEPMEIARARNVVRERLVDRFPRFRQRIVEPRLGVGMPSWEDDRSFDLNRHMHHIALPAPCDTAALQELVSDLIATPLDRSKPLWDIYIVDGYGAGTALVARLHHCIADGIALARVLISMTDERPDAGIGETAADEAAHGHLDTLVHTVGVSAHLAEAAMHEGFELLGHPRPEVRRLTERTAAHTKALAKLLLTPPDGKTVLRGELGAAQKALWTDRIALEEVKAIGQATGTTVNDVLVTAMTGALGRYLEGRGSVVDDLRAMIPVNLRPADEPLPRKLGNRFGLVYLQRPVGIRDRQQRLDEVHRRMDRIKNSPEAAVQYGILGVVGLTPPQVERRLVDLFSSKATLVLTNVPGPRHPVYFAGTRVAGVVGWVPGAGSIGVGISIFSYDRGVTVGLRVDAGLVPDPQAIIDAFEQELTDLAQLPFLVPKPARRASARPSGAQPVR